MQQRRLSGYMVTQLGYNGIPRGDAHVSQAKTMHKKTPDNRRLK